MTVRRILVVDPAEWGPALVELADSNDHDAVITVAVGVDLGTALCGHGPADPEAPIEAALNGDGGITIFNTKLKDRGNFKPLARWFMRP